LYSKDVVGIFFFSYHLALLAHISVDASEGSSHQFLSELRSPVFVSAVLLVGKK
jgi:hypothetical protein